MEQRWEPDAVSGATSWKHDAPIAPDMPAPGESFSAELERAVKDRVDAEGKDVDAVTGATPGVAAACRDLDMGSLSRVVDDLGLKPPGEA